MPSECNFLSSSDDAYEFECLVAYETLPIDTDVFPECVPLYSQARLRSLHQVCCDVTGGHRKLHSVRAVVRVVRLLFLQTCLDATHGY